MSISKRFWPLLGIITLGAGLRFYHFTGISLWHDEAFSALLIKYPWHEMLYRIGLDVHPPAYYMLLRIWHYFFGDALWSLRGFSALFGIGTIPMAYALAKAAVKNRRAALWAALLVAVNPFQIQYMADARMYSMGAFFALATAYFLVKALDADRDQYDPLRLPEETSGKKLLFWYLLFALCTSIIMYTHYYLLFTAVALMGYGFLHHVYYYRSHLRRYLLLLGSYLLICMLYIPWLKTFLFQFHQVSDSYWILPMTRWSIPATVSEMLLGFRIDFSRLPAQAIITILFIFSLIFLYRFVRRALAPHSWLIILNIFAPFIGALVFAGLTHLRHEAASVFLIRYFVFTAPFFSIALAQWLSSVRIRWISLLLVILYVLINLIAFVHYWQQMNVTNNPGMSGAAKYLQANVEPGNKLYIASSFEFFNYNYYNRTPVRPLLYSYGNIQVNALPHFFGTALLTNEDLVPKLETAKSGDTVWLLWTNGYYSGKPAAPTNWVQADEKTYSDVQPNIGTFITITEYKVK